VKAPTLAQIDQDASVRETVPRLMDIEQILGLLQVSRRHFDRLVHIGEFPKPLKIGARSLWYASDYVAYLERLRAQREGRKRHA